MSQTSPDVVKEIAGVMRQKLETVLQTEYAAAGGAPALAQILNSADRGTERNILEYLTEDDPSSPRRCARCSSSSRTSSSSTTARSSSC